MVENPRSFLPRNGLSLGWEAPQSPVPTESFSLTPKGRPHTLHFLFLTGPTEREEKRGSWLFAKWSSSGLTSVPRSRESRWLAISEGGNKKQREIGPRYRPTWLLRLLEEVNFKNISRGGPPRPLWWSTIMAPGATTLTSLLLLLLMARCSSTSRTFHSSTQPPFTKILKGVKLPGGYMEIIQEDHCSHGAVRLTCRSLKAFIFVLEAEYLSNLTRICGYDLQKLIGKKMYKSRGSGSYKKKGLKGNYIDDADEGRFGLVDVRQSLNKRYVVECEKLVNTIFLRNSETIYDHCFNFLKIELLNLIIYLFIRTILCETHCSKFVKVISWYD